MSQKKTKTKDPNMVGYTGDAPEGDTFDGVWPGLDYQKARTGEESCGYCLPIITVPDEPDDYSN